MKNLCFMNTLLQILHYINKFSYFFSDHKFITLQYSPCQCPVSNELCIIFNVNGNKTSGRGRLWGPAPIYIVLYCTVLYSTVLYCTVLYCTVLYYTVLYCSVP